MASQNLGKTGWGNGGWVVIGLHTPTVAWQHQPITWTNVDLSWVQSRGIHLRVILWEMLKISIFDMSLKIYSSRLQRNQPVIHWVISSPPSAAYMRQWDRSAMVQIMACRQFSTKPLSLANAGILSIGPLATNLRSSEGNPATPHWSWWSSNHDNLYITTFIAMLKLSAGWPLNTMMIPHSSINIEPMKSIENSCQNWLMSWV